MDSFVSFSNNKLNLKKKVKDYKKRSFIIKLLKYSHAKNLAYINDLSHSFVELNELRQNRKEKVFINSSQIYFYFQHGNVVRATLEERLNKVISDELSRTIHYKFAEVTAVNIAQKIIQKLKDPKESDRDEFISHQVLANTGALLELNCKASLHILSPAIREEYYLADNKSSETNWSYFIGFYFGTSAVHLPPLPRLKDQKESKVALDAHNILEKQLISYIGIDSPLDYSLVFDKFRYLFFRNYSDYKFKYIDSAVAKQGFFDSIGGFFSKAASVVSSVVSTATSVASTAMDVYQNTIKPIARTLAPVLSPMLPGAAGAALNFVASQNSAFISAQDRNKEDAEFLQNNFRKEVIDGGQYQIKVPQHKKLASYIGNIKVDIENKVDQTYTGTLINKDIILTEIPVNGEDQKTFTFSLVFKNQKGVNKENKLVTIQPLNSINGKHYFFKIVDKDDYYKDFAPIFELDFKKYHSSDFAFNEFLLNKDIFMSNYSGKKELKVQASKILKSDENDFLEAFEKTQGAGGAPIFYIDRKTQKYKIIGTCSDNTGKSDIISIVGGSTDDQFHTIKSKFLVEAAYKGYYQPPKAAKKESGFGLSAEVSSVSKHIKNQVQKDFETLRSSLKRGTISDKSSNLRNIGIFELDGPGGMSYGVGIITIIAQNEVLVTLKKYVAVRAQGKVFLRKLKAGQKALQFNLEDKESFEGYKITGVTFSSEDYVLISFDKKQDRNTDVQNNFIDQKELKRSDIVGGYFIEFDFSIDHKRSRKIFQAKWSEINSIQMERQLINSVGVTSLNQRLYYAYQKRNQGCNSEFVFGISNPYNDVKINYFYEEALLKFSPKKGQNNNENENSILAESEKIIFGDNRKIITSQEQLDYYEPVGIIMHNKEARFKSPFSGTGTFVNVTIKKNGKDYELPDIYIITCAHNFCFKNNGVFYDLSLQESLDSYLFNNRSTKYISTEREFQNRFTDKNWPNIHRPFAKVDIPSQYKNYLKKGDDQTEFDIAIVKLENQPKVKKTYKLLLNKPPGEQTLNGFLKNKDILKKLTLTGYPGSEQTWSSKLGIMYTQSVGYHFPLKTDVPDDFVTQYENKIMHKLSSLGGNSGSTIQFEDNNKQNVVIGIHTTGIPKQGSQFGLYNLATSIYSKRIHQWLVAYFQKEANIQ